MIRLNVSHFFCLAAKRLHFHCYDSCNSLYRSTPKTTTSQKTAKETAQNISRRWMRMLVKRKRLTGLAKKKNSEIDVNRIKGLHVIDRSE